MLLLQSIEVFWGEKKCFRGCLVCFLIGLGFLVFMDATKTIEGWVFIDLCPTANSDLQFEFSVRWGRHKVSPMWILMSDNTYNFDATSFPPFQCP